MDRTQPTITVSECPLLQHQSAPEQNPLGGQSPSAAAFERCSSALKLLQSSLDSCTEKVRSLSTSPDIADRGSGMPPNRSVRICHGCHGLCDESHRGFPTGADKCPLEHDLACEGGIPETFEQKGRWKACPDGYLYMEDYDEDQDYLDSNRYLRRSVYTRAGCGLENEVDSLSLDTNLLGSLKTNILLPRTADHEVASGGPAVSMSLSGTTPDQTCNDTQTSALSHLSVSGAAAHVSPATSSSSSTTVTSSVTAPAISVSENDGIARQVAAAKSRLDALKKKRQEMELLAEIEREEQLEMIQTRQLQQQLQASQDRRQSAARPHISDGVAALRARNQMGQQQINDETYYEGPNMNQIRKTPGLNLVVEDRIHGVRSDVPSLARRPDAGSNNQQIQARVRPTQPIRRDSSDPIRISRGHQHQRQHFVSDLVDLGEESTSLPISSTRFAPNQQHLSRQRYVDYLTNDDPLTEPSGDESDDLGEDQQLRLVYRRDKYGQKYRSLEKVPVVEVPAEHVLKWVTDPTSGRQYKKYVPIRSSSGLPDHQDTRQARQSHLSRERMAAFVPLTTSEKEGKPESKSSIVDWAKKCPVLWADKVSADSMNIVIWMWAYLSEILASRLGSATELKPGELEAQLQHALCVLQVCASHSEKTDFDHQAWKIARLYAKKVQSQLDHGLATWSDFSSYKNNPHPSELIAAKQEMEPKVVNKKKGEDAKDKSKPLCTTWNTSKIENKCDWMVKNPDRGRCNRRHQCTYCSEKGLGTFVHQRSFCSRRITAGDT